jgi:hypothetical protein
MSTVIMTLSPFSNSFSTVSLSPACSKLDPMLTESGGHTSHYQDWHLQGWCSFHIASACASWGGGDSRSGQEETTLGRQWWHLCNLFLLRHPLQPDEEMHSVRRVAEGCGDMS